MSKYFDGCASFNYKEMSNQQLIVELKEKVKYIGELKRNHNNEIAKIQSIKDKEISHLNEKLAECMKQYQEYRQMVNEYFEKEVDERMRDTIKEFNLDISQLKQQLSEKEKERLDTWKDYKYYKNRCLRLEKHNQDKIDFAVAELKKVKEEMTMNGNGYCEVRQCTSPHAPNLNFASFNYVLFNKFIDHQIENLKNERE